MRIRWPYFVLNLDIAPRERFLTVIIPTCWFRENTRKGVEQGGQGSELFPEDVESNLIEVMACQAGLKELVVIQILKDRMGYLWELEAVVHWVQF